MSCFKNIKKAISADGVKLPKSPSLLAGLKDLLSFKGVGQAMERVEGLVQSNIKNLATAFSPANIASKVSETVEGLADQITSRVDAAIEGVTNLKSRLQSLTQAPTKAMEMFKDKVDGIGDLQSMASEVNGENCAKASLAQAGKALGSIDSNIKTGVDSLSNADKKILKQSPDSPEAQAIKTKLQADAAKQAQDDAIGASATSENNVDGEPSAQLATESDNLGSSSIQVVDENVTNIFNSMITSPQSVWPAEHSVDRFLGSKRYSWNDYKPYIMPSVEKFFDGIGSGDKPDPSNVQADTITTNDEAKFVSPVALNSSLLYKISEAKEIFGDPGPAGDGNRTLTMLFQSYIEQLDVTADENGDPEYLVVVKFLINEIYTTEESASKRVLLNNTKSSNRSSVKSAHDECVRLMRQRVEFEIKESDAIFLNFGEAR